MIKKIIAWITGKSDTTVAEAAPYKVETPVVTVEEVSALTETAAPAAIKIAPVTVKAKYKKAELSKMTKAQLMELIDKHGVDVKARSTKEELIKVLVKV
jgi:D-arabinose 5-phosphate isomerase GutQ